MSVNYATWVAEVESLLGAISEAQLGYPPGTNEVRTAPGPDLDRVPAPLRDLYQAIDGLDALDVHVGYRLDPAEHVATAAARGEPTMVEAAEPFAVAVFGSDGGGGRFAVGLTDGAVYYLPSSAEVRDGHYRPHSKFPVEELAGSVEDFAVRLKDDIEAFVRGDAGHQYMAR